MGSSTVSIAFSKRSTPVILISLTITAYAFGVVTSPLFGLFLRFRDPSLEFRSESVVVTKTVQCWGGEGVGLRQQAPDLNTSDLLQFQTECGEPLAPEVVRATLLNKLFNGVSPFEEFPSEQAKSLLKEKRIKGWGSYGTVFERLITEVRPSVVVELGSFLGASAIHMASVANDLQIKIQILCVDDYRGWPGFRDKFKDIKMVNGNVMLLYQFMQNVVFMNFTEFILPLPFSTSSMLRKLCELGVYADLVEVDAGHDFHSAWADINAAYAILRSGGVLFGHDYFTKMDNRGVRRAVDLFAKVKGLRVEPDGQHWILRSK